MLWRVEIADVRRRDAEGMREEEEYVREVRRSARKSGAKEARGPSSVAEVGEMFALTRRGNTAMRTAADARARTRLC